MFHARADSPTINLMNRATGISCLYPFTPGLMLRDIIYAPLPREVRPHNSRCVCILHHMRPHKDAPITYGKPGCFRSNPPLDSLLSPGCDLIFSDPINDVAAEFDPLPPPFQPAHCGINPRGGPFMMRSAPSPIPPPHGQRIGIDSFRPLPNHRA